MKRNNFNVKFPAKASATHGSFSTTFATLLPTLHPPPTTCPPQGPTHPSCVFVAVAATWRCRRELLGRDKRRSAQPFRFLSQTESGDGAKAFAILNKNARLFASNCRQMAPALHQRHRANERARFLMPRKSFQSLSFTCFFPKQKMKENLKVKFVYLFKCLNNFNWLSFSFVEQFRKCFRLA